MKLILARHGETTWNRERRIQGGHSDVDLSDTGIAQARALSRALSQEKISAVYSSPLRRARNTAEAIAKLHSLPVVVLPELAEINVGELEGLAIASARERLEAIMNEAGKEGGQISLPGGESMSQLQERAWRAIQSITLKHPHDTVVLVSHFFTIQSIISRCLGLPLSRVRRLRLGVAAISTVRIGEGAPCLVNFNDTCHLRQDPGTP